MRTFQEKRRLGLPTKVTQYTKPKPIPSLPFTPIKERFKAKAKVCQNEFSQKSSVSKWFG